MFKIEDRNVELHILILNTLIEWETLKLLNIIKYFQNVLKILQI